MRNIAIIGGGIAGVTIAYELQKNKQNNITLFEKNSSVGMETSFANGGQFSACNAETWLTWKNVWKGLKWCMKKDAPLYFNLMPYPDKLLWLSGFLKNTALGYHERNTIETIRLSLIAREAYQEVIKGRAKSRIGQTKEGGMLHVYTSQDSFRSAEASTKIFEDNGIEWIKVSPSEIIEIDETLSTFKNLVGGYHTPSDTFGDIHKLCKVYARHIRDKRLDSEVTNVYKYKGFVEVHYKQNNEHKVERYDDVVFANGHSAREFSWKFMDFFNMYPIKGYSVTYQCKSTDLPPNISLLDDDKKIVSSTFRYEDDRVAFRIAGTAELAGVNKDITARTIPLHNWAKNNFKIESTQFSEWACLRPMTSDMMPIYRQSNTDNIWYHTGHGHLGLTLAAGTAKLLAEQMENK